MDCPPLGFNPKLINCGDCRLIQITGIDSGILETGFPGFCIEVPFAVDAKSNSGSQSVFSWSDGRRIEDSCIHPENPTCHPILQGSIPNRRRHQRRQVARTWRLGKGAGRVPQLPQVCDPDVAVNMSEIKCRPGASQRHSSRGMFGPPSFLPLSVMDASNVRGCIHITRM